MRKPPRRDNDYFLCKCCGARLPVSATFCRHCGASDECGWGEDDQQEELDLPRGYREDDDDDFDYDEFVAGEFPDQARADDAPIQVSFRAVVIILVCIALLASAIFYAF
jgi:hypothetical protein